LNDRVLVLAAAHKIFDASVLPAGYRAIKVGNKVSDDEAEAHGYYTDNSGDNIASENPHYCELTAQYWAWKNLSSDDAGIIGLNHYRRVFFDYHLSSRTFAEDILSKERIAEILKKKKVIVPFPGVKPDFVFALHRNRPDSEENINCVIVRDIIYDIYPEYRPAFDSVLYGRIVIWTNMIITTKEIFDAYSEWLFDVLKRYDAVVAERGEAREPRINGFLAEYLLRVWIITNFKRNQIQYMEMRNIETDTFTDYSGTLKGRIIKLLRSDYRTLCLARYLRIGYLLLTRKRSK